MMQFWFWSRTSLAGSLISLISLVGAGIAIAQPPVVDKSQPASHVSSQVFAQSQAFAQINDPQVIAQQDEVLTRAEIYKLRNQVELVPFNQSPRSAKLSDILVPQDALRTAAAAIAELLFNEGSIARVDANTVFRFREGLRRFQLQNRVAQQGFDLVARGRLKLNSAKLESTIIAPSAKRNNTQDPYSGRLAQSPSQSPSQSPDQSPDQFPSQSPSLQKETIFVLESGAALLMSPPNSVGTQVETSESTISIIAPQTIPAAASTPGVTESGLLLPPERSSAVMVIHDPAQTSTRVFALTDGDIRVFDRSGTNSTPLIGGQTVAVTNGKLGPVEEFDLKSFYRTVALAEGLGPGQESFVSQEPARVQITLNAIRIETLAAVRRQEREQSTFTGTFLRDALSGADSTFDGLRGRSNQVIIGGQRDDGTFVRTENDNDPDNIIRGNFIPNNSPNSPLDIVVDTDQRSGTISGTINGETFAGDSGDARFLGNDGVTTVRSPSGRVLRIEVFDIKQDFDNDDLQNSYRGRVIQGGLQPDR